VLIVVGVVRTRETFIWSRPAAWLFLVGVVAALVVCLGSLWWAGRGRAIRESPTPDETEKVRVIGARSSGIAS